MAKAMTCWSLHWLAAEKTLLLESLSNSIQEFNVRKLLETGNGNSRYTMGIGKCFKAGLKQIPPESRLLDIY